MRRCAKIYVRWLCYVLAIEIVLFEERLFHFTREETRAELCEITIVGDLFDDPITAILMDLYCVEITLTYKRSLLLVMKCKR